MVVTQLELSCFSVDWNGGKERVVVREVSRKRIPAGGVEPGVLELKASSNTIGLKL